MADTAPPPLRKIIHVDMDAFFASVEQRDNPELRGKPVAVGGSKARGVVAAASYEARVFGVRSAMPSVTAARLCPDLIFVKSRFDVYREVSAEIRDIFRRHTDLIEPLSLDEAYLDVTASERPATEIAKAIRREIRSATNLTASAGVSYNKFLAKIASDQNKPDGLCVIRPEQGAAFVAELPVKRFHGVGPVTARKMVRLGIETGADLAAQSFEFLQANFGKSARYYYHAARGVDDRPVRPSRIRKSIGAERTFSEDLSDENELMEALGRVTDAVWERIAGNDAAGRTVTLKVKFADFQQITRARSFETPVGERSLFERIGRDLLARELPVPKGVRLLGLTLSSLTSRDVAESDAQMTLGL
ncbi:DNA polymerase IV [Pacificimonas flava]|uniref:DNA polymerase IV n=2 Tax=Pacificimonas TaxID=1960290 RepID=A0A219B287_9SPHN|nr:MULTISPECIES: DNA polymerase IV [Pacificimonas]MBZ6377890.1 DNA polymerase IV [Pacificimonas aurantium]OWV32451.1 DNA polymerase IV [Pacificimonas flava]